MDKKYINIKNTPAIIWNQPSDKVFLYVHGTGGNKEETEFFAKIVADKNWQVLSLDLPGFGERRAEINNFDPWHIVPELEQVMTYINDNWSKKSIFANSIGAYFSLLAFPNIDLQQSLFVSPVLNMVDMIQGMMVSNQISEDKLKEQQEIKVAPNKTISWKYLQYAQRHPINIWNNPTAILYGAHDKLISLYTVEEFCTKYDCDLTILKNSEHYFHTPEQLTTLKDWVKDNLK